MAVTIREIAEQAGVSRGTVDRVLHNRTGVKDDVAKRVRQIAENLGYEPNRAGKILASRKQPIKIGCFLPSIGNSFWNNVLNGFHMAEQELKDFGISVLYKQVSGYDENSHISAIKELINNGCSALCVSTVNTKKMRSFINDTISGGTPVLAVNTDLTDCKRLCYVGCDYYKAGRIAGELLSKIMKDKINLIIATGSYKTKGHNDRIKGFTDVLNEKKTELKVFSEFESLDDDKKAFEQTEKALKKYPDSNCIYIAAAGTKGVCKAVIKSGFQHKIHIVTQDLTDSVKEYISNDIIDFTIDQQPQVQGYQAIKKIFNYFMNNCSVQEKDYYTDTLIKIKEQI